MLSEATKKMRNNRRLFRTEYSKTTEEIVKMIAKGLTSHEIADELEVPLRTVATTKGNLTRDFYYPYAFRGDKGQVEGTCKF